MVDQRNTQPAEPHPSKALSRTVSIEATPDGVLCRELTEIALNDLKPALKSDRVSDAKADRASDAKAERGAREIGIAVAGFRTNRQRGINPEGEIMRLTQLLGEAQATIKNLTPSAKVVLNGCFRHFDKTKLEDIVLALPDVLEVLNSELGHSAANDPELHSLIVETGRIWRSATGKWPTGGHKNGEPDSALYDYLRANCGARLTPAIWERAREAGRKQYGAPKRPRGRKKK